jgi:ankyrin repeat protein
MKKKRPSTFQRTVNTAIRPASYRLTDAAKTGDLATVKSLLRRGTLVDKRNSQGNTALILAVWHNHMDIVRFLIDHGADVNKKSLAGSTALLVAARYSRTEAVRLLLDKGADIDAATPQGSTALTLALKEGKQDIILMLRKAADIRHRQDEKTTVAQNQQRLKDLAQRHKPQIRPEP